MKNSKSYKEERAEVIEKMEGLVASAEGRDLSSDEQSNFDSLNDKVEELNKMAVRAESFEKLQATKAVKEVTENTPSEVRDYSFQDAMNQAATGRLEGLGLQAYANLERFNAEDTTGIFAGFALIKEIGPVITALLFAGRAGTSLASEIGLMKATDQLSAMEMMAVDPLRYVAVPRFLGGVISMPLLTAVFTTVGLLGSHLVAVELLGVDVGAYWQQLQSALDMKDVMEGIYKSITFGIIASLLAVWEGYNSVPTAEGVGRATTRTVVITAIAVLVFDFMITAWIL